METTMTQRQQLIALMLLTLAAGMVKLKLKF